jgi:hypothetical protein
MLLTCALLLAGLGLLLHNLVLLLVGGLLAAHLLLQPCDEEVLLAESPTPAASPPVDARAARKSESAEAHSFVHIPLYQETFPYEKQPLDIAYSQISMRNAVDPALLSGSQRVEFVQFLNEGKGPCRKDHWMVQAEELPPVPVPEPEGGGATIS